MYKPCECGSIDFTARIIDGYIYARIDTSGTKGSGWVKYETEVSHDGEMCCDDCGKPLEEAASLWRR